MKEKPGAGSTPEAPAREPAEMLPADLGAPGTGAQGPPLTPVVPYMREEVCVYR